MAKLPPFAPPKPSHGSNFSGVDPLDGRYFDAEVSQYLSEDARVGYQAYVEAALSHTLAEFNLCSGEVAAEIEQAAAKVTAEQVYKGEERTKHDIKALVDVIKNQVSDRAKPYVHMMATSYDIVSTASSLQYRDFTQNVLILRLNSLLKTLVELTKTYADTPQIGRTHGQHALPITFGFALSEYVDRLGNSIIAINALAGEMIGKFSGAVGAYNAQSLFIKDPLAFEIGFLTNLGLKPSGHSTQIIPPEPTTRLLAETTIASGIMANLATDMRHLQRTEIAEIREKFEPGQTGSSTMAHKRNPISFENVVSFNKQVLAQFNNVLLNLPSEHQRDLTDSASARFYPIMFAAVAIMTERLNIALDKIEVDPESMTKNLALSQDGIGAEPLYLLLGQLECDNPHEKANKLSQTAKEQGISLAEAAQKDPEVSPYWDKMTPEQRQIISEPDKYYIGLAAERAKKVAAKW